jgi:L-lactate dehydrogenase complex protein LldE
MSNSGDEVNATWAERLLVKNFVPFDYIVGPSGSCVKQVRCHFDKIEQAVERRWMCFRLDRFRRIVRC